MKRLSLLTGIILISLIPLACQKTYSLGPLPAPASTPTPTATPNPELNRWSANGEVFDVTVDPAGNFYALNTLDPAPFIDKFSATGTPVTQWGAYGTGNGQFSMAWGIAYNPADGLIYVTDSGNSRVQSFQTSGVYVAQFPTTFAASAIAIDTSGNLYLGCSGGVEEYTSGGIFITSWGSTGSGNGQFYSSPQGLAVDASGNVFATDGFDHRVEKFNNSGTYLAQWGSNGTGNGQFKLPWGIAVNSAGDVYVVDQDNDNVQKFDNNGNFLSKWGGSIGYLNGPSGAWMDAAGHLFIANSVDSNVVEVQF